MKDSTGKFVRIETLANDKNWLYQKYTIDKISWKEFYDKYEISPTLLQYRLKEFGIKRKRISWNKGTLGVMKSNTTSFKNGHKLGVRFGRDKEMCGEQHWNWQGGITSVYMKIRNSQRYKQWRKEVFERDNFTCTECGKVGGDLNADHITPFCVLVRRYMENDNKLFETNNGRTLCKECHKKTDTYLSKSKICLQDVS